mmetsp:Transcript_76431/g.224263  ORF Transcript_76431/g.224263 Transcript_76431/m.224263 type:complete len:603 (-) Transcript_76431:102-1910(-)
MPIVGLSDFGEVVRANSDDSGCYGPGGIYHEKQVGALCGLHSVNNILQGPHYTVQDLRAVAQELDRREREITDGQGLDYGNACADGFYNVQVIQVVVSRAGCDMVPLKELPAETRRWQRRGTDIAKEKAFILNKHKHWFALRRIGKEWFDLNSCLSAPSHYTKSDLRSHIAEAMGEGYAVFVVRGIFPSCELEYDRKKLREAVKGCQDTKSDEDLHQHHWFLLVFVHFFGALQFDSFAPAVRRVQDNFRRRSFSELRRKKLEHLDRISSASTVLPSNKEAPEKPEQPEQLLRQRWPVFTLAQSFVAFGMCLSFSMLPPLGEERNDLVREEERGLESILPGKTTLVVHRDCQDHRAEVWRWLSYQFTHGSVSDAGMSVVLILAAGISLEGFWGPLWTALFFNVGVLAGACCHMVVNTHSASLTGMSAGCYSLVGVHLADLLLNWQSRRFGKLKLLLGLVLASVDQTHALARTSATFDVWAASASVQGGGCLAGFFLGAAVGPNCLSRRAEKALLFTIALSSLPFIAFCAFWIAQWPPRSLWYSTPWCWVRQVYNSSLFNGDLTWHCIRCEDEACIQRWSTQRRIAAVDFNACNQHYGWYDLEI